ncbi:CarboxypepD_reg-like domain-containing protein [Tenacibaculum sp. 190524A02b]|uniref:CarboxypepD_reg-like domain-containing protein n=1 Tax=Tenacibaculum vairaonense TaxID=3137860 RepID=A0ABM9PIG2_9FLAO
MKTLVTTFLLFCITTISSYAQTNRKPIYGVISDKIGVLPNVHIINLNSKQATYTNDYGAFKIPAKTTDSLRFSFIGYETKIVMLTETHFGIHENKFTIEKTTYTLDEVEVKKHNLLGSITSDIRKTPKDRRAEALQKTMDFSKVDMNIVEDDDHIDERVRPHVVRTDPNLAFIGAGTSVYLPFGYSKRLWALRKELALKQGMPAKLISELGEKFFFEDLQIPPERYYHFLEYCNPLGIEALHNKGELLKVIKILENEHKDYLKIINNTK